MWVTVPSPILVVCRFIEPMEFLVMIRTHRDLIHQFLQLAADRIAANLKTLLEAGVGPIIRFGGAEHCTPPLGSPDDFDEYVMQYDQLLVSLVKQHDCFAAVHCHGQIRHALRRFVEMGIDQTDPVEQVPDGDLTLKEVREISGRQITLTGNVQMRELAALTPNEIRARVRDIIDEAGTNQLIISATGAPLEPVSQRLEDNYNAMIDATLEYGS